ncbi:MAG TPA: hypothetical protein VFX03_14750, partial [Thermomicrobiales bacterium]|nr:hypothetical protein [Thermomicrobiales bacterium]
MRRLVAVGALLVMLVVAAPAAGQTPGIPAEGAVSTAGIGLAQDAWTAAHGPGDYGQNYVIFENGRYFVQFRDGVTSYIEYGWDKPGVRLADAQDSARAYLPSDARLTESFALPATSSG